MGPDMIDSMPARMDAVKAAMDAAAALQLRVIKRSYLRDYDSHSQAELSQGVITLISNGEGNYKRGQGMVAKEGTHRLMMIGHLKVSEQLDGEQQGLAVEAMEMAMIEEIKTFARAGVPGMGLSVESVQQSRQQAAPYGWIVVYVNAGPPGETTY